MNAQSAVRSILAAIPLAGFLILDFFPNLVFLKEDSSGWVIVAIYPKSQIAAAQPIMAAPDGTGTTVTPGTGAPSRYDIKGGTTSRDGANLFHSFTRFGLNSGETANFISNPNVKNILGRIVGGDASLINGLIQVSGGNSNLYLMNPAGIIFGSNARLDVPGSFFATTASGIGFDSGWFNGTGANNYAALVGTPNTFAFGAQPGSIVNAGDLAVENGQSLTLLGGTVISTGRLSAPGGQITVAAVPGENLVRLSQDGLLLSLEVAPAAGVPGSEALPFSPLSLPKLLSGSGVATATGITTNDRGEVVLTGGITVPASPGTAVVSGEANVSQRSSGAGGTVNVLGDKVGVLSAKIEANGPLGGGTVRIGGDYRGEGTVPKARMTYVDGKSSIAANATRKGDGGRVFVWADNTTAFLGRISATGVSESNSSGVGGFVEISGKQRLMFNGTVDTSGTNGLGTLLFDPENIFITDSLEAAGDAAVIANSNILATGTPSGGQQNQNDSSLTISRRALESISGTTNLVLEALNDIKIADLADNKLSFAATTGSVTLRADADRSGAGVFSMNAGDTISTRGGAISLEGSQITAGNLSSNGGNISLISPGTTVAANVSASNSSGGTSGNILLEGLNVTALKIDASGSKSPANVTLTARNILGVSSIAGGSGNITLTGNEINLKGDKNSISGTGFLVLQPWNPGQNIAIAGSGDVGTNTYLNLTAKELESLQNGFAGITIGRSNGSGSILIANEFTFYDPLIIQSPTNSGTITSTSSLTLADNASITLKADGNIRTGNITTNNQEIRITSTAGNVTTAGLRTGSPPTISTSVNSAKVPRTEGGDVSVTAEGTVTAGAIDTRGDRAGNVTLTGRGGVTVGAIEAGGSQTGGNITLTGNEIDLTGGKNSIASNGNLVLQPIDPTQNITIAGAAETEALDLTAAELNSLRNGFASVAIGRADGSGSIAIAPATTTPNSTPAVTFQDPTTIRSPLGTGEIVGTGAIVGTDNATIALFGGSVAVGDVTSNAGINITSSQGNVTAGVVSSRSANGTAGNINIRSAGSVEAGNVNAFGASSGGDISIVAPGRIVTGVINSSSQSGSAGSSKITGQKDVEVVSIKANGNTGGDVAIQAGGLFRAAGSETASDRASSVSVSTDGQVRSGSLTLLQSTCPSGNCTTTTVGTGNSKSNATSSTTTTTAPLLSLPSPAPTTTVGLKNTGNSTQIVTQTPAASGPKSGSPNVSSGSAAVPVEEQSNQTAAGSVLLSQLVLKDNVGASGATENGGAATAQKPGSSGNTDSIASLRLPEISRSTSIAQISPIDAVQQRDRDQGREFERYFGGNLDRSSITQQSIRDTLSSVNRLTGVKPAIVYVWVKDNNLELVLLLPDGKNVFKSVPASRETVLQVAKDFTNAIRTPKTLTGSDYKQPAQQLYQWLIAPLQPELDANKIDTLAFSMDAGLRTLPLAALFDGKQFLVEKYSLGLIPSLSLTDTRYADVKGSEVLAMGASKFPEKYDQNPLPAVPLEISTIVGKIWHGASFLNEGFTLANLKEKRNQPQYKIIHLATHGDFQPGGAQNSYIQFWDTKLRLNQLGELKLSNPQVELLVLSACTTAVGDEQAELGFAGLAVHAGVKSALASLWYVSDAGTLGLMTEFYQQLREAPIKAEALRQAQLAMLRQEVRLQDGYLIRSNNNQALPLPAELTARGDRNLSHPYYWAAFTMIGSPW
ncbi:MAG: CHAT domain-containing protein [Microcoleus sp. PH2017_10_PVI_O_A]|uniref:CHAT domain-containing protein n=1 Tax=unclassified Microcoleus TaxID=2642155 RepID=UPI001D1D443D|nr:MULTISPECIES: CHAT domain-containing protein [unclassified Microcoleus]TAE79251.1 MAG: CHAT domain-containing protein [Oscillatoriales cyanobacterium]MCC3408467.1 CHAT domain-containing protein [Microcoleus sp. PH2017_10_PVI_O_A]MCC3462532.1 CHAT domain-containing protein [Microcoleus sp. PH2017_11_PCY_U_A]MCC3480974.1 CHAT domain-containing protein [Microcoleus sp. PH2017_12_PCY_D_A]MCC3561944.1 CHAT domain-containing protein [Microcoleus sp. PH2017_27_LUM_O_A]